MKVSFDTQINPKELFRFNMYQTYTTAQGPISIALAVLVFVMAGVTFSNRMAGYGALYLALGVMFLVYIPLTLWTRAKQTLKKNQVLAGVLHYTISEEGVGVAQGGDSGLLPWTDVYKIISTKRQVLIYSSRVNAYIIPRDRLGGQYEALKSLVQAQLPPYRVRMK